MKNQTIGSILLSVIPAATLLLIPPASHAAGGDLLWTNQLDTAAGRDQALAVTGKGRGVFVAGRTRNAAGNDDWQVNSYDAVNGAVLWTNRLDLAAGRDEALSIALAGKVVAAAGRVRNGNNDDWFVRAYDTATGTVLWSDQYNLTNGNDRANAIAAAGKTFVAAGRVRNIAGDDDWFVRAYDTATGTVLWSDQYDSAADNDEAVVVTILGTKAIAVGHVTNGAGDFDWLVRAYDLSTGNILWTRQLDKVAGDDAALAITGSGRAIYVSGYVGNAAGNEDWEVRAYDAGTGNLLWEDQFDFANDDDRAVGLAIRGKTLVAVGRVRNVAGDSDFAVRTYDASNGSLLWQDRINPAGFDDSATGVTISGSTIVAFGRLTNANGDTDWAVRAYSAKTGGVLWNDQYDQAAGDDQAAAAIALGKRIVVVGDAQNLAGDSDWLLRTYAVK
ncbi:MAG: PQQ-binding-like beta-propeller repeat protein [Verrucomicrobiota bacterium]